MTGARGRCIRARRSEWGRRSGQGRSGVPKPPLGPATPVDARADGSCRRLRLRDDAGTMTILTTGILAVILMVIGVGVAITGVQLERNELQSMADGAALAASQGFSEADLYAASEPGGAPPVHRTEAERIVRNYLRAYPVASTRTRQVMLADLTVEGDGMVRVVLAARTDPPLIGWVTRGADLSITLHAAGNARAR